MKQIYKILILSSVIILSTTLFPLQKSFGGIGDTTVVQTLRFDTTMRAGVFMFPNDTTKTYQKITMFYRMRCKNGLVSTQTLPNQGCGEWDYNCYTYIVDSTQTDSLRLFQNSASISNFTDTVFNYTTNPVWTFYKYNQQNVTYTSVVSQDSAIVGSGNSTLAHPFNASATLSRSQYLWTAAELLSSGLTAGNITGLKLNLSGLGSAMNNLRIRIKNTTLSAILPNAPETTGFTEVFFLTTSFSSSGMQRFNFHTPFNWNGTSNIIVDFSFTNATPGTDNNVVGHNAGFNAGLLNTQASSYLTTDGSLSYIDVNSSLFPSISNQITIALWAYGDTAKLPANTSIVEGVDNNNKRQVNIHFPWNDSNIYWDCGNDGAGYDRINRLANAADFEGKWNFWVFTKNATTGAMTIYLNGVSWATGTAKIKLIDIKKLVIGMGMNATNIYKGSFDEVSIWNKALSLASIQQIMYQDITNAHPDYANLLAYYKLDEGSGLIANDASPNGYHSPIFNPGWMTHRANTLFRNFTSTIFRPNTTFIKGVYTTSVQTILVLDSVINHATSVISYNITNNTATPIDTLLVWPAGYAYTYNTAGVRIDSSIVPAQNTIYVTQLSYYNYRPMKLELINFITPYGKGLTLDGLNGKTWEFDVTDYGPALKGPIYLAMEDGKYQEDNDIKFVFYEGIPPRTVKAISNIWPNAAWLSPSYSEITSNKYFEPRDITLIPGSTQFKLRSAISGHGQEGEFIPRNHTLRLNNSINFTRSVWKECATNPIYPQGGTWPSDRAGWCPGAAVDMKEYEITPNVTPGATINLDYSLPTVANAGQSNYRINNQIVSYGDPNFTLDAAIDYIKTPSMRVEFQRLNPLCNAPVIAIKNTGSTVLTSLDITYGRVGGTMSVYHWTGSLNFLAAAEVTLPAPNWMTSTITSFVAYVSNPNAGTDQYGGNDTMMTDFNGPAVYPSGLVFDLLTNAYGSHTAYTLKDSQGNILISLSGLSGNTTYRDTVYLATDCYTVNLTDVGDDGLSYWANTAQGTGHFYIRNVVNNAIIKNFNPDFGRNIYQQFTVNFSLPVSEPMVNEIKTFQISPNPAGNTVRLTMELPINTKAKIKLLNMLGQELISNTLMVTNTVESMNLDLSQIENGFYIVMLEAGSTFKTQKLTIAK